MHTLTFNKEKLLTYISKIGSRISDQDIETTYHFDYKKCEELGVVIFISGFHFWLKIIKYVFTFITKSPMN